MKITVDLPASVVRAVKLHTVHRGRRLKETTVGMLRAGMLRKLPMPRGSDSKPASTVRRPLRYRVTLPLIRCRHAAAATQELTADTVAQILLKPETG